MVLLSQRCRPVGETIDIYRPFFSALSLGSPLNYRCGRPSMCTLWWTNIAIENGHLWWIFPLKMVIFHSYVSSPEGMVTELGCNPTWYRFCALMPWCLEPAGPWCAGNRLHDDPRMAKDGQGFQMLEKNDEKSWKTYEELFSGTHIPHGYEDRTGYNNI